MLRPGIRSRQETSCARYQKKAPGRRPAPLTHRLATSLAAVAALLVGGAASPPAAAAPVRPAAVPVRLDPGYQQAPFEGWGTALAWFANVTDGWPDAQRNRLADALYGTEGIGLTIARYNIGGGDSPETEPYMRGGPASGPATDASSGSNLGPAAGR
ncbi:hypothetical protein [Streptomyces sp. NBC_01006]|uniref:hypothetical protein n=1 Tax=Streptomyces sp. NBC_01006 TaxID=2903716 RepID=UPI00386783E6|nr:hypothetical protein OG509_01940 [Streptomyces sp. NBC_01006]